MLRQKHGHWERTGEKMERRRRNATGVMVILSGKERYLVEIGKKMREKRLPRLYRKGVWIKNRLKCGKS